MFMLYFLLANSGPEFLYSATEFSRKEKAENTTKFGPQNAQFGPRFWQFPKTPILSHFRNNLHLDSKLVMMPI